VSTNVKEWLEQWCSKFIDADARGPEGMDVALRELVRDAEKSGIPRSELEIAAGGNVRNYISHKIRSDSDR